MNTPRAKTKQEARKDFLDHIHSISEYWANLPDQTSQERCDGLAFSILVMLDGDSMALPAMDIYPHPHPDDKDFLKSQGENWYDPHIAINNDCALHELWDSPNKIT